MRSHLLLIAFILIAIRGVGQSPESGRRDRPKPVVYSASSEWQKVTFKTTPRLKAKPVVGKAPANPTADIPTTRQSGAVRQDVAQATTPPADRQPPVTNTTGNDGGAASGSVTAKPRPGSTTGSAPANAVEPARQPAGTTADQTRSERPPTSMSRLNAPQPEVRRSEPVAQPTAPVVGGSTGASPDNAGRAGTSGYRPAFTGDFVTNRNGWKVGNKGDYNYQIGVGKYNIRKRNRNTSEVAFSYVPLPSEINLNIAETFTIRVDVVADSGRIPTGGLLFGVRDSLNFCAFTMNGQGEISIIRVANGDTFSDYMPGDFFAPGVPVNRNRNRLTIRRKGDVLHFYINEQEVRSSPYPVKMFSGNNIGLITSGYWTSFQKLGVVLGM